MFTLRFDFRLSPQSPATMGELYRAGLEMASWGESHGALAAVISQHHGSADGYLPSPMVMATAIATRTSTLPINLSALLLLMYDPVKLAEDISVLDHLSGGRVTYTIGMGYRDAEYAMFGVDPRKRAALMDEHLDVLRRALAGERFEWRGRSVHVTPLPATPNGPMLMYGGSTVAAARRAGRLGMVFLPSHDDPAFHTAYDDAATAAGNTPGMVMAPSSGTPHSVFVADDPDAGWAEYGSYLLHDATAYGEWLGEGSEASSYSAARTVDALRAENGSYRIVDPQGALDIIATHGTLGLQPLCGGLPPDLAWQSLHTIERSVLPALGR